MDQLDAARPKMLVDPHGRGRGYLKGRQHSHQVSQHLALRVTALDLLKALRCNASDLQKTVRFIFQNTQ